MCAEKLIIGARFEINNSHWFIKKELMALRVSGKGKRAAYGAGNWAERDGEQSGDGPEQIGDAEVPRCGAGGRILRFGNRAPHVWESCSARLRMATLTSEDPKMAATRPRLAAQSHPSMSASSCWCSCASSGSRPSRYQCKCLPYPLLGTYFRTTAWVDWRSS